MLFLCLLLTQFLAAEATFCQQSDENTLHIRASEKNCSNFIACINFEEYEFSCIQAPMFIPWTEEIEACILPCPSEETTKRTTTKSSTELPPDILLYPDSPDRTIVCPPDGDTLATILGSCTEYIKCSDGIGTKIKCPAGQEFVLKAHKCVPKNQSTCSKAKPKGLNHIKCRYDNHDNDPIYFQGNGCDIFLKCANKLAWTIPCAEYCEWDDENQTCEWADLFDCNLANH